MEMDLKPRFAQKLFEGKGGEYYSWSSKDFPFIAETKVGGGRFHIQPRGFALPHYADCSKIGYVLQGEDGLVGIVLPNTTQEVVLRLRKGDIIPVPLGALSWWYNQSATDIIVIVFLGKTTEDLVPGEFTYFFQATGIGILSGFSHDFIGRAYDMTKEEVDTLITSQKEVMIIQLSEGKTLPKPSERTNEFVYNIDEAKINNGELWTALSESKFPFIGKAGLSVNLIELGPGSMTTPIYTTDSSVQMIYVVKGLGRIQIVGVNGQRVLDSEIQVGHLVIVPKFFVVAIMASDNGLECLSAITSSEPVLEDLASKKSTLAALSQESIEISFDVTQEFAKLFLSKIKNNSFILPPIRDQH